MAFTQSCEPRLSGTRHLSFAATLFGVELLPQCAKDCHPISRLSYMVEVKDLASGPWEEGVSAGGLLQIARSRMLSQRKFPPMPMTNCSNFSMAGTRLFAN